MAIKQIWKTVRSQQNELKDGVKQRIICPILNVLQRFVIISPNQNRVLFQEAKNVDEAFITIARAALQQEADTELYNSSVPERIDLRRNDTRNQNGCSC